MVDTINTSSKLDQAFHLLATGHHSEALEMFERLSPTGNTCAASEFGRSIALVRLNRIPEACRVLRDTLATGNPHPQAKRLLAELEQIYQESAAKGSTFHHGGNFYGSVILNPATLAAIAVSQEGWKEILSFHTLLATDEYTEYLDLFYREGVGRFGHHWNYYDIVNVLYAAAKTISPRNYLEIGVRRGRSLCTVARARPDVTIAAFDMWIQGYAGMENPGPDFVRRELTKHGYTGTISFIDGDSHVTIPHYFRDHPDTTFDLITVDGDHSETGALEDLCEVIPHLSVGGVIVFDDIAHPAHPYLLKVWNQALDRFSYLQGFEYIETGYGVAFAIRRDQQ